MTQRTATGGGYLSPVNIRPERAVSRKPGYRNNPETGPQPETDIASTDMSVDPSSRDESTQAEFGEREAGGDAEVRELKDRHLRLAAEFDNYRKRVARERSELSDRAQGTFMARLLDVLDDLDRLVADDSARSLESMREAVMMIDRKLRKELEAAGVERVDPTGQPFNPEEHEAVSVVAAPDETSEHLVSATFQPGYRFKGLLIRPARVQVYSGQSPA